MVSSPSVSASRGAVAWSLAVCGILLGLPYGIVALRAPLIANGVFAGRCGTEVAEAPCAEQAVWLAQAFQLVSGLSSLVAWPFGVLLDVHGPTGVLVAPLLGLCGIGYTVAGMPLGAASGVPFVGGMLMATLTGASLRIAAMGAVVPLATDHDPVQLNRVSALAGPVIDVGCLVAAGLALAAAAVPLWLCFAGVGCAVVGVFLPWYRVAVAPILLRAGRRRDAAADTELHTAGFEGKAADDRSDDDEEDDRAELLSSTPSVIDTTSAPRPLTSRELLGNTTVRLILLQTTAARAWTTAVESAAGELAPLFGLPQSVTLYVPVVVAVAGTVVGLVFVRYMSADYLGPGYPLRLGLLAGCALTMAVPALRCPATYWAAMALMSAYRTIALGFGNGAVYMVAPGAKAGTSMGMLKTTASVLSTAVGQPVTFGLAHGGGSGNTAMLVTTVVGMCALCAVGDAVSRQRLLLKKTTDDVDDEDHHQQQQQDEAATPTAAVVEHVAADAADDDEV